MNFVSLFNFIMKILPAIKLLWEIWKDLPKENKQLFVDNFHKECQGTHCALKKQP